MISNRQFKDAIAEQFARVAKALGSPKRIELLDLLGQSPRTVEALAHLTGMSMANTSQHLQVLKGAALVEADKVGPFVTYRIVGPDVASLLAAIRSFAEARIAEVERLTREFLEGREGLERLDQKMLAGRVRRREVTVLDVRPAEEYQTGHIPGAVSLPLGELRKHLGKLPKNGEIVAYCRGPYCVLAVEAVEILRKQGFKAFRFEDGVQDWRARGYPIAAGHDLPSPTRKSSQRRPSP